MQYYQQTFGNGEKIYAMTYDVCKNGNIRAIIISDYQGKAKKTTLQNHLIWEKITANDVPTKYIQRMLDALK